MQTSPNGRNRLLAELLPIDFALLAPHLRDAHYKQGVLLQNAGDPIERVYFPQSGMISVLAVMQAGNAIETATIGREGDVGAIAGLGGASPPVGPSNRLKESPRKLPLRAFKAR
jgi:CRP-like cAMP-binding protein